MVRVVEVQARCGHADSVQVRPSERVAVVRWEWAGRLCADCEWRASVSGETLTRIAVANERESQRQWDLYDGCDSTRDHPGIPAGITP